MIRVLKWIGIGVGGLLVLVVLAAGGLYVQGGRRINAHYTLADESIPIPTDSASIARGRHFATVITVCTACHGDSLSGTVLEDVPNMVTLVAPNLTRGRGGAGNRYTDADFVRVIRHGVNKDGRGVLVMHADRFHNLGAEDLGAIVAYVKSVPPADHEATTVVHPLGRIMVALGLLDSDAIPLISAEHIDHTEPVQPRPEVGPTVEYGRYLMSVTMCTMCHGEDFRGAPPVDPSLPPGPNIAHWAEASDGAWTVDQFINTLRTGTTPDGRALNPEAMPWEFFGKMTDLELTALWRRIEEVGREG